MMDRAHGSVINRGGRLGASAPQGGGCSVEGCTRMGENSGENKPCKEWGVCAKGREGGEHDLGPGLMVGVCMCRGCGAV